MLSISASTRKTKTSVSASEESYLQNVYLLPGITLDHAPLEAVYIYFDTATYDEIARDEKVVLELQ